MQSGKHSVFPALPTQTAPHDLIGGLSMHIRIVVCRTHKLLVLSSPDNLFHLLTA